MGFKAFFNKDRFKGKDKNQSGKLTPEEELELSGYQPDMQEIVITSTEKAAEVVDGSEVGEDDLSVSVEIPEKGVLRTENLVKKYGKRTVANKV